ncbi:hypothetical protein cco4_08336, partial [Campylobacter coli 7--1]
FYKGIFCFFVFILLFKSYITTLYTLSFLKVLK